MPFVSSDGYDIHYSVEGSGPLVLLQHGLLSDAESWKRWGFVDALKDKFCVAAVDSLGHGQSDKPSVTSRYSQAARSRDLVAVVDDLGYERAHCVGYSMGGWLGVGMAKHYRNRLSSLVIGGWDITDGVNRSSPPDVDRGAYFLGLLTTARQSASALVAWVTPEYEPGVCACWEALAELDGAEDAVMTAGVPLLLWSGREDPNHGPMQRFATDRDLPFLSTDGDHQTAIWRHGQVAAAEILGFLQSVEAPRQA